MNDANLIPITERTKEEQRAIQSKAGIASGKSRRRKKNIKELVSTIGNMLVTDNDTRRQMENFGCEKSDMTYLAAVVVSMINKAISGDVRAAQWLMDVTGESPQALMHKEDLKQRKAEFEYRKQRDTQLEGKEDDLLIAWVESVKKMDETDRAIRNGANSA